MCIRDRFDIDEIRENPGLFGKLFGNMKKQLTSYRRFDIGFVFQFYNLVQNLTALENVELAAQICKDCLLYTSWPSSPSSGGNFKDPDSDDVGDRHYWDVWHGEKPFSDYENYYFR